MPSAPIDNDLQTVNVSNFKNENDSDHDRESIDPAIVMKRPVSAASYLKEQSFSADEREKPLIFSEISDQEILSMCDRVIAENSGSTPRPMINRDLYSDTLNYEHGKVNTTIGESKIELNALNQNDTTPKEMGLERASYMGSGEMGKTPEMAQIERNKPVIEHTLIGRHLPSIILK